MSCHGVRALIIGAMTAICAFAGAGNAEIIALSTSQARAIAVGGAYFSGEDELFSAQWNPATFGQPGYLKRADLRVWLSPTTAVWSAHGLRHRSTDWVKDDRLTEREVIFSSLWGVRGIALGWRTWYLGFINSEEPLRPSSPAHTGWSSYNGITGRKYTFALAFKLAPQVSFGASAIYDHRVYDAPAGVVAVDGWGGSFGIMVKPSTKLNFGLTYVLRADTLGQFNTDPASTVSRNWVPPLSSELERVDTGTINGGVSFYPWNGTALFLDVRNLDEPDSKFAFAEVHVGVEQTLYRLVSVRAGWYNDKDEHIDVYSGGIGIKPLWIEPDAKRLGRVTDMFSYTYVYQHNADWTRKWHMVALVFPIVF